MTERSLTLGAERATPTTAASAPAGSRLAALVARERGRRTALLALGTAGAGAAAAAPAKPATPPKGGNH